jgi:ribosomal protein S12 methylthiotransferase accessory factor
LAAGIGMETFVLDQTRPDIGLSVAKVMVPGMRHFWKRFAPGRLYDTPVKLGWLDTPKTEAELNPVGIFLALLQEHSKGSVLLGAQQQDGL